MPAHSIPRMRGRYCWERPTPFLPAVTARAHPAACGGSLAAPPAPCPATARPEDHVRRILVADDFPAFSRQMGELMASLQEGEASAQRLAHLVLRDYALTVKVIRTANTVHYNRTGRPVQGATHAILLLGARTVRELELAAQDATTYDTHRVLLLALEAALRGGPCDRAAFCPIDIASGGFRARFGLGDAADALCARFALPFAGPKATHGPSLLRGQEVHLGQGTRLPLADAQALRGWGATTAALFPVALQGTTIGAVYLDRRATGAVIDPTTLVYVRRVVAAAAGALARRRGLAAAPARPQPTASQKSELVLRVLRARPRRSWPGPQACRRIDWTSGGASSSTAR